jgi:hypothetical protein
MKIGTIYAFNLKDKITKLLCGRLTMRRIPGLILVLIFLLPNTGLAVWYDMKGQPVPDTSYRKAFDGFGASLLLTDKDEDVFKRWDSPSLVFEVPTTSTIEKGMAITPLIFFTGCKEDAKGNCNVVANYKIWQPDGNLYGELPQMEVWINKPAPPAKILGLSVQYVKIIIEPKDQRGQYIVDAEVIDLNKKVKLLLRSSFTVVEQKSPDK